MFDQGWGFKLVGNKGEKGHKIGECKRAGCQPSWIEGDAG